MMGLSETGSDKNFNDVFSCFATIPDYSQNCYVNIVRCIHEFMNEYACAR